MLPAPSFTDQGESGDAGSLPFGAAPPSADDAFSRALGAMYWCGYWTAVYHVRICTYTCYRTRLILLQVQRTHEQRQIKTEADLEEQEEEEATEMLVSTQR